MFKILLIAVYLTLLSVGSEAQIVATKTKMHFWSDPNHDFFGSMNSLSKKLLDSLFRIAPVDTVNCIRLNFEDGFEHMKKPFMSTRKYRSYTIISDHGEIWTSAHKNDGISYYPEKPRVILRHVQDSCNTIDKFVLVILE